MGEQALSNIDEATEVLGRNGLGGAPSDSEKKGKGPSLAKLGAKARSHVGEGVDE